MFVADLNLSRSSPFAFAAKERSKKKTRALFFVVFGCVERERERERENYKSAKSLLFLSNLVPIVFGDSLKRLFKRERD